MATGTDVPTQVTPQQTPRIELLDALRGLALVAMAIYHTAWDLGFFGYVDPGLATTGGWKIFARCIATSFLVLVGISLVLAHGRGIRWRGFLRRFALILGAALAITLATMWFTPDAFIFFGILHHIAFASVVALAFLRMPWWMLIGSAAAIVWLGLTWSHPFFAHPALLWLGLSPHRPLSNDFVPVFPWFAAVLAGVAIGRLVQQAGLPRNPIRDNNPGWRPLSFLGRHSLAVYLIHQPLIIAVIWVTSQVLPPDRRISLNQTCIRQCSEHSPMQFCETYCGCLIKTLDRDGLVDAISTGRLSADDERLNRATAACRSEVSPAVDGAE